MGNWAANTGDAVKFVADITSAAECDSAVAVSGTGTSSTDLLPDDAVDATSTEVRVTFDRGGEYKICYKLAGMSFQLVDLTISVAGPTGQVTWTSTNPGLDIKEVFTMDGFDLDSTYGGDRVKFVDSSSADCSGAAGGGVGEVIDLDPGDETNRTYVSANATFTVGGIFRMCY